MKKKNTESLGTMSVMTPTQLKFVQRVSRKTGKNEISVDGWVNEGVHRVRSEAPLACPTIASDSIPYSTPGETEKEKGGIRWHAWDKAGDYFLLHVGFFFVDKMSSRSGVRPSGL